MPMGWTDFYVKVGRVAVGLRWRVVQNHSPFTTDQLDQLIVLTLLKMGLRLPRGHPVEFTAQCRHKAGFAANHQGITIDKRRWSAITVRVGGDGTASAFTAVQLMASFAHELEHARQWCKKVGNSRPGSHGDHHELLATRATEHMLIHLVTDESAVRELYVIVKQAVARPRKD